MSRTTVDAAGCCPGLALVPAPALGEQVASVVAAVLELLLRLPLERPVGRLVLLLGD